MHKCIHINIRAIITKKKIVVSALRHVPKPGYGLAPRSHTFSASTPAGGTTAVHPVATVSAFSVLLHLWNLFELHFPQFTFLPLYFHTNLYIYFTLK